MTNLSMADYQKLIEGAAKAKVSKFKNKKVVIPRPDGDLKFDSIKESKRFIELEHLEKLGVVVDLQRQVEFKLEVNGELICKYKADFVYDEVWPKGGRHRVVEDVKGKKGTITPEFRLKAKLMKAIHGIDIKLT